MDKKALYDKVEKAFNQAFEVTKHSMKVFSEKAGEAAHVTRLMVEKASLEHRVTKKFARLGSLVYETSSKQGKEINLESVEFKKLIQETEELDRELTKIEMSLEQEKKKKPSKASETKKK